MAYILKRKMDEEQLESKIVCKDKVRRFSKKFIGLSYKKKVKVPPSKTTKSHHRLRNTWILQFLTFCRE